MKNINLLIIDDDFDDRVVYKRYLKNNTDVSFAFIEAVNGEEAIDICDNKEIDCILLDYLLPDIAGIELIKKLEKKQSNELLPIVAITGEGNEDIAAEFIKNGAKEYLSKSNVTKDSLIRAISNAISISKLNEKVLMQQKEIEAFSNRVAHDLRGSVSLIYSMSNIALEIDDMEKIKDMMSRINNISIQANRVIEGIYELCNIGKKNVVFEPTKLEEIINNSIGTTADQIEQSKAEFTIDCPHQVKAGINMMPRVFHNLITNSIKFIESDQAPKIFMKSVIENNVLRIDYEDNGPGIAKKHRQKLFNAFVRLHGEDVEGLGIGLNIVKKILEIHDSRIWIEDPIVYEGAHFVIEMPIEQS
jgi:signal transduction histidine kinase